MKRAAAILIIPAFIISSAIIAFSADDFSPVWQDLGAGQIRSNAVNTWVNEEGMASNNNPTTGAISRVLPHPTNSSIVYAGGCNGGIWKSVDGGVNWTPLTDRLSSLSIATMNFDSTNSNIIIAGTGRTSAYGYTSGPLTGIQYSTDGGTNWSEKGKVTLANMDITGVAAKGAIMMATVRNIETPLTTVGLYRSTDTGATFSNAVTGLPAGNIQNLAVDPTNNSRLYLSVVNGNNAQTGVYRSDDTGATWTLVKAISGLKTGRSVDEKEEGRILLSVGSGGTVVAQVQQDKPTDPDYMIQIWRSGDQGATWTNMGLPSTPNFTGLFPSGQTGMHGAVLADPNDPNVVYAAGDTQKGPLPNGIGAAQWSCPIFRGVYNPTTGVTTWTYITNNNTLSSSAPHADARSFAIDSNGRLLFGGDGGLCAYAYPATVNKYDWFPLMENLRTTEMTQSFWNPITHTASASAQDVGSYYQFPGQKGTYDWSSTAGGDGGACQVNSVSLGATSVVYASSQYMGGFCRFRAGAADTATTAAATLTYVYPQLNGSSILGESAGYMTFVPIITLNRKDPKKMAIGGKKQLFIGTDELTVDTANGYAFAVTSKLTPTGSISSLAYGTNTIGLNVNDNALLAGSNDSKLYYSADMTDPAKPVTQLTNYAGSYVYKAIFDDRDGNRFYIADGTDIWRSTDAGASFASIKNDLPSAFLNRQGLAFASNNGVYALFAGGVNNTANGSNVYVTRYKADSTTDSATPSWSSFGGNLANAIVYGLSYDSTDDVLLVNLLGRGAWAVYDLTTYFPEATSLIFGKANNDSAPAATLLVDGTPVGGGATFARNLVKNGTGTLTISGSAATYTGTTTISAGTLQIGAGSTTGGIGAGNIIDNGTIAFNRSNAISVANAISGTGAVNQIGAGTTTLAGANTYTGATTVSKGSLKIDASTGSLAATTALTLSGTGTFNYDNTTSTAARSQNLGALTFSSGDGTVQSTRTALQDVTLTFSSLAARTSGATGNFVVSGGTNGTNNQIVLTGASAGFIDQGIFFGGSKYAYMNGAGTYVRGINYGVDLGTATSAGGATLAGIAHQQFTGAVTAQNTATFTTLNDDGNNAFTLAAGQTVTTNGILKTGNVAGGATISGGTAIQAASNAELVIRTDGANDSLTISTPILANGTNALTKSGAGTLTLSGANTYTGDTKVNAGTLAVGNNLALQNSALDTSGEGVVNATGFTIPTLGGLKGSTALASVITTGYGNITALTLNPGTAITDTYSGAIADGAAGMTITKSGLGTQVLSGANTFTGATTINGGTLKISADSGLGAAPATVTAGHITFGGGTLQTSSSITINSNRGIALTGAGVISTDTDTILTYSGIITGASSLTKAGAGTLVLNGANTHAGGTNLGAGTLTFINGSLGTAGTVDFTGNSTLQWANGNTQDISSRMKIDDGVTATLDTKTNTVTLANAFQLGAGKTGALSKAGTGILVVSGANNYTGITTITAGTLRAGNARAFGTGAVTNSATLDLGVTSLALTGAYTQNAGSTLALTANSASNFGNITSTVAANVNAGSTVAVTVGGYVPNKATLTVINTGGAGIGAAPTTVTSTNQYVSFTAAVFGNNLVLTAGRGGATSFSGAGASEGPNASAVGSVLDNVEDPSPDMEYVLTELGDATPEQVASSEDSMTPIVDGAVTQSSIAMLNHVLDTTATHLENVRTQGPTGISTGDGYDYLNGLAVWAQGLGDYAHQDPRGSSNGYNATSWGISGGADIPIINETLRMGIGSGYGQTFVRSKDSSGRTDIDSVPWTMYWTYENSKYPFYLDSAFAFMYNTYRGSRKITAGTTIERTAFADYNGQQYCMYFEGGYSFFYKNLRLTPLASVNYMHLHTGSYTETGADALNLSVDSQDYDMCQTGLGAKISVPFDWQWASFTPDMHFRWLYDWIGDTQATSAGFAGGGTSFATQGYTPAQSEYDFGTKITLVVKNNVSFDLAYDFLLKEDYYEHCGTLNVRYSF